MRVPPFVLVAAVLGAGTIAVLHAEPSHAPLATAQSMTAPVAPVARPALPSDGHDGVLPPNHPPIHASNSAALPGGGTAAEQASITWTVPAGWKVVPNPNAMRIATYVVKSANGDAEITVSRAGGSSDANIERWIGQFDDAGKEERSAKAIRGVKISQVEVGGTYRGGMGAESAPRQGWALCAVIAEAAGTPYFFKMTGPKAGVHAARASFDALIGSITPS